MATLEFKEYYKWREYVNNLKMMNTSSMTRDEKIQAEYDLTCAEEKLHKLYQEHLMKELNLEENSK